jgi:hypothetical protein
LIIHAASLFHYHHYGLEGIHFIIVMGNYKTKHKDADATKEERIYPEPQYEIKTRPPITEGHTWKQNIQLRVREEQLADEAMPVAR